MIWGYKNKHLNNIVAAPTKTHDTEVERLEPTTDEFKKTIKMASTISNILNPTNAYKPQTKGAVIWE